MSSEGESSVCGPRGGVLRLLLGWWQAGQTDSNLRFGSDPHKSNQISRHFIRFFGTVGTLYDRVGSFATQLRVNIFYRPLSHLLCIRLLLFIPLPTPLRGVRPGRRGAILVVAPPCWSTNTSNPPPPHHVFLSHVHPYFAYLMYLFLFHFCFTSHKL